MLTRLTSGRSMTPPHMASRVVGGMSMAIGSLPHRTIVDAIDVSFDATDIVTIPTLPKRSPAESMIAQALVGLPGFTVADDGSIVVDPSSMHAAEAVRTDLDHDAFATFRAFLDAASRRGYSGPVKWQFIGPITLGLALQRAGVPSGAAFEIAIRAVRGHVANLLTAVHLALPNSEQIVVIDEPEWGALLEPGFPLAPDLAIDLLSGALAVIEPVAIAGVHCCSGADLQSLTAAGPSVISVPATLALVDQACHLQRFLENGGWVAWGAVATDGPVPMSAERPWKRLCELWCQLVQRGCSPALLRQQSLVTPECGLALHHTSVAERVLRINAEIATRVRDQSAATRFSFGA
ncbi:MAG: hypothetical protein JWM34_4504 [Ilumatobacteraceae bacterium]|nr:hypothetical protein [Ilumatobacteraceae bacterium]